MTTLQTDVIGALYRACELFEIETPEEEVRTILQEEFHLPVPVREEVIEQAFERAEI